VENSINCSLFFQFTEILQDSCVAILVEKLRIGGTLIDLSVWRTVPVLSYYMLLNTVGQHIFEDIKIFEGFKDINATSKIFILKNFCTNVRINGTLVYPQKIVHANFNLRQISGNP